MKNDLPTKVYLREAMFDKDGYDLFFAKEHALTHTCIGTYSDIKQAMPAAETIAEALGAEFFGFVDDSGRGENGKKAWL